MIAFEQKINEKIGHLPHLVPIISHVFDMPRRIKEYDSSFFVVFNKNRQKYEVHSLDYPMDDTLSCTVPYDELDERALHHIYDNDIRVHGDEIFRRIERSERLAEQRQERERKNWIQSLAKETQSMFAKDAWN
jgi:hypothetical protein